MVKFGSTIDLSFIRIAATIETESKRLVNYIRCLNENAQIKLSSYLFVVNIVILFGSLHS